MIYTKRLKTITLKVSEPVADGEQVLTTDSAFDLLKSIYSGLDDDQEHFTILFLNNVCKITGFKTIFSGGQCSAQVDIKLIFRNALIFGAMGIICCHNHPGGSLEPSEGDHITIEAIRKAGELLGIKLMDNFIITKTAYTSFKNRGLL